MSLSTEKRLREEGILYLEGLEPEEDSVPERLPVIAP
jgi:hypothetical protein